MRLAEFIRAHHEVILVEWEAFARTLTPAAEGMNQSGLRDHADEILTAIVRDMESAESVSEKSAKSKGHGQHRGRLGQLHAVLRIEAGFTLTQVVAEYRALRASVLRLWAKPHPDADGVLRFNEAIDAALAEAVDRFTTKTNDYRDQLIAIVSHDLRNPLSGILMGSGVLTRTEGLDDKSARLATRIQNSAKRMVRIVDDLLDLTRTRLGSEIQIVRRPMDAGPICEMVIAELEGSHPHAVIRYTSKGDLRGEWDSDRLAQVVSNLVGNALQHGDTDKSISVTAQAHGDEIALAISNAGPPIPENALNGIFEPNVRNVQNPAKASTGLGLGLFIAKELVTAHGGTLGVTSTAADGTTFTVRLPRLAPEGVKATGAARENNRRGQAAGVPKGPSRSRSS
jgi:signal transduction histidine kinase